jgi:hypothetical protein
VETFVIQILAPGERDDDPDPHRLRGVVLVTDEPHVKLSWWVTALEEELS